MSKRFALGAKKETTLVTYLFSEICTWYEFVGTMAQQILSRIEIEVGINF